MHLLSWGTTLRLAICSCLSVPATILWVTFWTSWNEGGILLLRTRLARAALPGKEFTP